MSDLSALKERLEKASGPDRELDRDLFMMTWQPYADYDRVRPAILADDCDVEEVGRSGVHALRSPTFTASIDAALGLVERKLPGWSWDIGATIGGSYSALVWTLDGPSSRETFAPTAPLAILIALVSALVSALIAQEQETAE